MSMPGIGVDVGYGVQLALDARAETYLLHMYDAKGRDPYWDAALAVRGALSVGKLL